MAVVGGCGRASYLIQVGEEEIARHRERRGRAGRIVHLHSTHHLVRRIATHLGDP